MKANHLPLALLRQARSILEALGENGRSFDQQVKFAQVLGYHRAGLIEKAGSLRRFEAGYLDRRETSPSGIPYGRGSTMSRMHRLVLKAEAQGLLEPEQTEATEPSSSWQAEAEGPAETEAFAEVPIKGKRGSRRGAAPESPLAPMEAPVAAASPSKAPVPAPVRLAVVEGGKGVTGALEKLWEKLLEIYEKDAPAEWPRMQRNQSLTGAMLQRVTEAIKIAGSSDELIETFKRALKKVPKFYRETYPVNSDGMKRRATDFLPCLFSGDSKSKDLGPGAWRLFEWADTERAELRINGDDGRIRLKNVEWTRYCWVYPNGFTEEQRHQGREDSYNKGQGPHPDWPDGEDCLWSPGMSPDPATIKYPQHVARRIQAQLNGALSNET